MQEKTPLPLPASATPPPPPPAAETLNAAASAEKQEPAASSCPALPVSVPKICYNRKCGKICGSDNRSPNSWPGWRLHSGCIADLCQYCSLLYEQFRFCEVFHFDDSGWRACNSCQKKVHCGCIASLYAFSLLDTGGIECADCARKSNNLGMAGDRNKPYACITSTSHETNSDQKAWPEYVGPHVLHCGTDSRPWLPFPIQRFPSASQSDLPIFWHTTEVDRNQEIDQVAEKSPGEMLSAFDSNKVDGDSNDRMKNVNMKFESVRGGFGLDVERTKENSEKTQLLKEGGRDKFIQISSGHGDSYGDFDNHEHTSEVENERGNEALQLLASKAQDVAKDEVEPSLTTDHLIMSLGIFPARNGATESNDHIEAMSTSLGLASSIGVDGDTKEHAKTSGLNLIRPKQRQLLPKPLQTHLSARVDVPKEASSQPSIRVARPPGEGRGRNQLLPRYWPRITEQELQQIVPGDSNSTITALFEKMLSASDAGRIGRLVLPKACAEAYFPSISQPEGVPLNIQDVSGKEWVFQFRFWPNNNSRMYVLEGVTPCIQSMQLQAGDTVTFSRLDPEGKLIMGYRRAPISLSSQDNQPSTAGMVSSPASLPVNSGGLDSVSNLSKLSALLSQTVKGGSEPQINAVLGQLKESGYGWYKPEKVTTKSKENTSLEPLISEKRRGRNLGSKSKRLRLEVEDSIELKLSWEEMQELLRPPPNINPSIVTIEGHEFEEYEDPPVFGKRTILTAKQHGPGEDQWAQCDDCGSWRKVPSDVFLPTRWTCADNVWDQKRAACSAPQEVDSEDINNLLHQTKGQKKVEVSEKPEMVNDAASGLDTLANAATLGENVTTSFPSPGPTTKHPRHRPGCTCIVCIQPPSGKGPKHKSTCVCNVCTTVKRRFKTLMMRRKKRQSEREAETARKKCLGIRDEGEISSTSGGMKWKTETHPFLVENGLRHEDNLIGGYVSQHSFSFGPHKVNQPSKPVRIAVVEELLGNKGQIDLNSQPDREEETKKSSGRISMLRLLQFAKSPLDSYLKQHGFTNLFLPPQMLIPPTTFSRDLNDPNSCHLTIDQPPERIQDEAVLWLNQAKADQGVASIQGQSLSEPKSSLLKSSET